MYIHIETRKIEWKKPLKYALFQFKKTTYCFIHTKYPEIVSSVIDNYPYKKLGKFYFWKY